jgi:hypothetical protein
MPPRQELLQPASPQIPHEQIGHLMLAETLNPDLAPESLFQSIAPGEDLVLPTNHLGSERIIVPSLEVVSPRGNEARLVDIRNSDPRLAKLHKEAASGRKGAADQIQRMNYEAVVRMLDTSGAEGLHHVHGTNFPRTVFYDTKRVNGATPNVYLTTLGDTPGTNQSKVPVIGMITATTGAKSQLRLMNIIGADTTRQRFSR